MELTAMIWIWFAYPATIIYLSVATCKYMIFENKYYVILCNVMCMYHYLTLYIHLLNIYIAYNEQRTTNQFLQIKQYI